MTNLAKKFVHDAMLFPPEHRAGLINKLLIMENNLEQVKDYCIRHESTFHKIL
jgi:hypothetical protein